MILIKLVYTNERKVYIYIYNWKIGTVVIKICKER